MNSTSTNTAPNESAFNTLEDAVKRYVGVGFNLSFENDQKHYDDHRIVLSDEEGLEVSISMAYHDFVNSSLADIVEALVEQFYNMPTVSPADLNSP